MNKSLIVGRINRLKIISKTRRTFHYLDINSNGINREHILGRCIHYTTFNVGNVKNYREELPISLCNKWNIFKQIETNRNNWCYIYTRRYITEKNELTEANNAKEREKERDKDRGKEKEKERDKEKEKERDKEKEKERDKEKEKEREKRKRKAKIDIESQNSQKKERNECISGNVYVINTNETQEKCLKKKTKAYKNNIVDLKKEENDELLNTTNKTNSDKQKDVYNIWASKNINDKIKNNSLNFHQSNETLLKNKTMVENTSCSTNKNQIKKADFMFNIQTETNIKKNVNVESNATDIETLNIKKKNGANELLISYMTNLKVMIQNLFEKHLLIMNCLIAGTLYFIADITCQLIEKRKEKRKEKKNYDLFRTLRMAFIGISLEGPIMTWWYGKILAQFVKSKPNTFFYKSCLPALFDNFIFGPIHLTVFFFYNGILKKQNKEEIKDTIFNTGSQVFVISLFMWTPLTLVNFFFVPRVYQATTVFFADFFWVNFLSWCANKKA